MSIPTNKTLYNKVKKEADKVYDKPSAYKSGWIVKEYKKRGGEYAGKKKENKGLDRWYKEDWEDIGGKEYPVYRPTKRITKDTPLTESEISPTQLKKQIKKKQQIKGDANLPAFQKKGGNKISTSTIMGDIDFDNMNWGSFKKQFQASKKKLGVSSLEGFANHILDNPKGFRDTTKKRANFYKNVILKKKGGSKPSEDDLLDEFMGSFADERTAEEKAQAKAADDRKRENDELIRNMPTQPHLNRYVLPTLRPPHIAERRTYNTPVVRNEYIPELEETSDLVRRYKEVQDREKKGGMMQVSDDENDLLPEATVDQVADVLQGDISDQTHDALMAILPQHGQAADRNRLRDSLVHYGYGGAERAAIMNAYNNLYNAYHTPVGSDDESEMSEYSSSPGVPMVSDDESANGGSKKNPKTAFERMEQMIRERDAGLRDANFETDEDKVKARERQAKLQDRLKSWRRERDIYIPHDETAATILDDDVSSGGRHIVSHTVRPFFAMN